MRRNVNVRANGIDRSSQISSRLVNLSGLSNGWPELAL
jgi:hypothetical protein